MEDSTSTPLGSKDRCSTVASAQHNGHGTGSEIHANTSDLCGASQGVDPARESTVNEKDFCREREPLPLPLQQANVATTTKDGSEDSSPKKYMMQTTGIPHDDKATMSGADEPGSDQSSPQSPPLTMDETSHGLFKIGVNSERDNRQSKEPLAALAEDTVGSSGVAPRSNDINQDLVVDEKQFRSLAQAPSPCEEDLEDGIPYNIDNNNTASSPIDVISFAASDAAMSIASDAPSPNRKRNVSGDNFSASSANGAESRRRDRCYFTIVVQKATHGQMEEMDLSEMGEDELNDEDRKQMMNEGEDFTPNNIENGSSSNPQSIRSGHATDDPSLAPYMASADSKFEVYAVVVDRRQDDKASEIALCSMERPHMRGFHFAWMAMFSAFLMWFAITPLLSEIQISLGLSKAELWTSSVFGTTGTIVMRVIMGPLCDKYGSRLCMSLVVLTAAIPCAFTGLVNTANGLYINRLCVGIAGASFVTCEYWTSSLFIKEIAGTANSLVSGWGNLGGAITQIMMGSVIFPILKYAFGGESNPAAATQAWRLAFIFPATIGLIMGSLCWKYSDDCPKGNYIKREKQNLRAPVSAFLSLTSACWEFNTWILVIQYACCFGVEFAMNNAAPLYFRERFDLTTEASAAVASIFGFLNIFARGMGGFVSDVCNARYGMRGRILWMFVILVLQGCSIILFGYSQSLAGAITVMVIFSLFVQAAEGSVYAIVPYVNPSATGSISGVVGAGGTVGGAVFAVLFREYSWESAFRIMGVMVAVSSILSFLLRIRGFEHTFYFCKKKTATGARDDRCPDALETNTELLATREDNHSSDIEFDHL